MANSSKITLEAENQASAVINQVAEDINRLADTGERIEFLALAFGGLLAAIEGVKIVSEKLAAPIDAYLQWKDAVDGLTESEQKYVEVIQQSTGITDTLAGDLLKLAEAYGIAEEKQDDLVTAAIGLADTLDQNVNQVLLKLADFLQGNSKALDSIIPQLREMTSAEEKLAEIERLAADGLASKADKMDDLEGAQSRYSAALERMSRLIGESVAPALTVLLNIFSSLADAISNVLHDAMDLLHRDFVLFAEDLFSAGKLTEFFELSILAIEKAFVQLSGAFASVLDLAGVDVDAFLEEVELRLRDIDRRADNAIDRRIDKQNRKEDPGAPQRPPLANLFNISVPDVPDFDLDINKIAQRGSDATTLAAFESRLLTGSGTVTPADMTARNTERAAKAAEEANKNHQRIIEALKAIADEIRGKDPVELEVVG